MQRTQKAMLHRYDYSFLVHIFYRERWTTKVVRDRGLRLLPQLKLWPDTFSVNREP
jgi:hypothetical protein